MADSAAFITQRDDKISEVKKDIVELEDLLSGNAKTSQSTLLLKKRKEMREVDESLELMKLEYKRRMDACEERREHFEAKQTKMREQVLKFEKYIRENDAKRHRAELKAKQEHKLYEQKCHELNNLLNSIDNLKLQESNLVKELDTQNKYTFYLETLLEYVDGFDEIGDILKRYDNLKNSNSDLMYQVQEQEQESDKLSYDFHILQENQQNQILIDNSALQSYQKDLEAVRSVTKVEKEEQDRHNDRSKSVARESTQVIESIKNIFARCQSTMRVPGKGSGGGKNIDHLSGNLVIIESRLVDLIEIIREFEEELHHQQQHHQNQ